MRSGRSRIKRSHLHLALRFSQQSCLRKKRRDRCPSSKPNPDKNSASMRSPQALPKDGFLYAVVR
ncbi:hypothetical protein [Coleofasciculus sp. H7-2]|uniref:hypothetical protein n=1 Tax=Coleofasciculus sp. H7-2 TaxID=3351545 RepID=UPI003670895F